MVFLDEAGDHSLDPVDKDFPVFVLVILFCEQDDYAKIIVPAFTSFKIDQFGHFDLKFVAKKANVLGHQLADLCAYPIARRVIDPNKSSRAFDIVRSKILDRPGWRHGFKVFP